MHLTITTYHKLFALILQFGKLFLRQIKQRNSMGLPSHSQNIYIGPALLTFSNLPDSSKNSLSLLLGSSLHFKIIYPRQEPSVRANFLSPALCNPRFQRGCYLSGDCPTEVEVSEQSHIRSNQFQALIYSYFLLPCICKYLHRQIRSY